MRKPVGNKLLSKKGRAPNSCALEPPALNLSALNLPVLNLPAASSFIPLLSASHSFTGSSPLLLLY